MYPNIHIPSEPSFLQLRVNTVHEKGTAKYTQQDSLDEAGGKTLILPYRLSIGLNNISLGGNLNAASRQALMQKLARTEPAPSLPEPACVILVIAPHPISDSRINSPRVNIPQSMQSRSVLLKNMFDPEE
jgi:RNA-binding protein 39